MMQGEVDQIARKEPFASFWRAWQDARRGNEVPHRSDINIRDFSPFISNMIIYDYVGQHNIRYRLAGGDVSERIGTSTADLNFFDTIEPETFDRSEQWWKGIIDTPAGAVAAFTIAYQNGIHRVCEMIKFPIIDTDDRMLILSLLVPVKILREGEPRENIRVGLDYFNGLYIDIGYGLPYGEDPYFST